MKLAQGHSKETVAREGNKNVGRQSAGLHAFMETQPKHLPVAKKTWDLSGLLWRVTPLTLVDGSQSAFLRDRVHIFLALQARLQLCRD